MSVWDSWVTWCCTVYIVGNRPQFSYIFVLENLCWWRSELKLCLAFVNNSSLLLHKGKWDFKPISKSTTQLWEYPSVFLQYVNLLTAKHWLKTTPSFMHALSCMPQIHMVKHWNAHKRTSTHLTHYLNVGDPLSSSLAPLVRQDRQDKISGFGQRLSDQEGVRFVSCHKEFLCIRPRQVTVVPPETQGHWWFMMQPLWHILTIFMHWAKCGICLW